MFVQTLILCGGSGSRLWPLSRDQFPKQLLSLSGSASMLQATVQRLLGLPLPEGVALEMIEVQSGSYLGEDDIVRFEDVYGR